MMELMPRMVNTFAEPNAPEELDIYTPGAAPCSIWSTVWKPISSLGFTEETEPVRSRRSCLL